ncbi:hypothetical protein TWF694_003489 [Orbilia ellipsospora]|uniref:Uncharacterized protein n=1 Tax=Orbilia ellipsospora TaxID=2528407 RepID=A0AAV9WZK7_9PEZI
MPSSIPYDPSLVLGQVVDKDTLNLIETIAGLQAPIDATEASLNAALASRRSFDMLKVELANLGIDTKDLDTKTKELNGQITTYAKDYIAAKLNAEDKILAARSKIKSVSATVETPVDYMKTLIKTLPLAANSMNMDVQYFSLDSIKQKGMNFADAVSNYVADSVSFLGIKTTNQATTAARSQVAKQLENHEIVGTLVLSVTCTHKNASVLAPFILNVDKGVRVWNRLFSHDPLDPTDKVQMIKLAAGAETDKDAKFSIISGMTFGSSFVGMVHVVNNAKTKSTQAMSSIASSLQEQLEVSGWIEDAEGGFGINATFANQIQSLFSSQNVTSHVTLLCMGVIPSIVSHEVQIGVKQFAEFNPKSTMEALATLQNSTTSEQGSVAQGAGAARTGAQMVSMKAGDIKAAVSALATVQDGANKILDINSMMTALDDYLKQAANGDAGVPINFYLKDITKIQLAEMWVNKYFPTRTMIQSDDSNSGTAGGDTGGNTGGNTGGKEASGGDPSGGDPSGGDPSGGDPSGGDPSGGDPSGGDPSGGES